MPPQILRPGAATVTESEGSTEKYPTEVLYGIVKTWSPKQVQSPKHLQKKTIVKNVLLVIVKLLYSTFI
jgi:hypothetical protein